MKATVKVVGMVAGGRGHIVSQIAEGDPVLLVPEPTNEFDPHAVAVYTAPRATLTGAIVSSLKDQIEHVGMVSDEDRRLLMDRQAGYIPREVAATLDLPAEGIVGFIAHVRNAPPEYLDNGQLAPSRPAGFDVCAWLDRRDPDLDNDLTTEEPAL